MALKPDRQEHRTDISFFMNEVAERGLIVVHSTVGSGAAMDSSDAVVIIPAASGADVVSGHPAGLLLNDVVNLNLTRQHINFHKDEVQLGSKVTLLREGFVVTDQVSGAANAVPGEPAFYHLGGVIVPQSVYGSSTQVGRFLSEPDTDGFAKVEIHIV
jgi:hypothetical protein